MDSIQNMKQNLFVQAATQKHSHTKIKSQMQIHNVAVKSTTTEKMRVESWELRVEKWMAMELQDNRMENLQRAIASIGTDVKNGKPPRPPTPIERTNKAMWKKEENLESQQASR